MNGPGTQCVPLDTIAPEFLGRDCDGNVRCLVCNKVVTDGHCASALHKKWMKYPVETLRAYAAKNRARYQ